MTRTRRREPTWPWRAERGDIVPRYVTYTFNGLWYRLCRRLKATKKPILDYNICKGSWFFAKNINFHSYRMRTKCLLVRGFSFSAFVKKFLIFLKKILKILRRQGYPRITPPQVTCWKSMVSLSRRASGAGTRAITFSSPLMRSKRPPWKISPIFSCRRIAFCMVNTKMTHECAPKI